MRTDPARANGAPDGNGMGPPPAVFDVPPPTLDVDLNGVRFPTPVLGASGCFNTGKEVSSLLDLTRVGGIVTKSVTLEPRRGLPVPRMAETASGMLNAIGLQNVGVDEFRVKELDWLQSLHGITPVIVSIAGRSVDEFAQVAIRVARPSCGGGHRGQHLLPQRGAPQPGLRRAIPTRPRRSSGVTSRLSSVPMFAKLTARHHERGRGGRGVCEGRGPRDAR